MKEWTSEKFFKSELRTIQDTQEFLKISRTQIYRLRDQGKIDIIYTSTRCPRIFTKSVKWVVDEN